MKTLFKVALITGFLTLGVGNLAMQSQPANYQQQNKRPIQLIKITPEETAKTVTPEATLSARLDLLRGPHPILPSSLKLFVDGVDVTQQARIVASDDIPSSRAEIFFKPARSFSVGKHTAEIRFSNEKNQKSSYTWEFYVQRSRR